MEDKLKEINNRIKQMRKELELKQGDMAGKIFIKQSSLSDIENGRVNVSERVIMDICREFNTNETWLRYGTGEMFVSLSEEEELERYVNNLKGCQDDFKKNLILTLLKLDDSEWNVIKKIVCGINDLIAPTPKAVLTAEDEKELEQIKQEMLGEKGVQISSASPNISEENTEDKMLS